MRLEELKKSFWGYQKDTVFRYITQQEEAFTQRLAEKDALRERMDQQAQSRITEYHLGVGSAAQGLSYDEG